MFLLRHKKTYQNPRLEYQKQLRMACFNHNHRNCIKRSFQFVIASLPDFLCNIHHVKNFAPDPIY